jgi:branched-subunit amino acid aminotransferase/4-amino-4-deoxychorismate lyase
VPHERLRISIDDVGFRQGVTVVERLRTYQGRVFASRAHLDRWQHSTQALSIAGLPGRDGILLLLNELLSRNADWVQRERDIGITMFATPGQIGGTSPTLGLHLHRLDHARIHLHRERGQPLVVTDVMQPESGCWPRRIKTRARIHYYLADQRARQHHQDAVGVLLDSDGTITETSIANLAIVQAGGIVSPPVDRVLGGITQSVVERLASETAIEWTRRPISVPEFLTAECILMMGTDGGIWFASSVNGHPADGVAAAGIFLILRDQFDALVGDVDRAREWGFS